MYMVWHNAVGHEVIVPFVTVANRLIDNIGYLLLLQPARACCAAAKQLLEALEVRPLVRTVFLQFASLISDATNCLLVRDDHDKLHCADLAIMHSSPVMLSATSPYFG